MRKFLLLLISLMALPPSFLFAVNDIGSVYAVLKEKRYNQTDTSAPTLTSNQPFRFSVFVSQAAGGTLTGGTVTPPNTGTIHTAQALTPNNDGTGSQSFEQRFDTFGALNATLGDGPYSLHITGTNGTYDAQLTVSGEVYPNEIPQILNTSFGGGGLVIDPTQPFTVTWNSFADHGPNDVIVFTLNDSNGQKVMQQFLAATATSQLIPANTLQFDQGYSVQLLFFKVSNTNATSIPGSNGAAGYGLSTKANVVPRGNLFASVDGNTGNGGGSIFQYTSSGAQDTFDSGLDHPRGVAFDSGGRLFVAINNMDPNSGANQGSVLEIDPDGTENEFATGFTSLFIEGLATDSAGNVFVVALDQNDINQASTIFKFTPDGMESTFGSVPAWSFSLTFDSAGNLYAGDNVNLIIYKFAPDGTRSVFVGSTAFTSVQAPVGLAFDRFGNLFVSTENNSGNPGGDAILKFTPDGMGESTFATGLNNPRGLAFDSAGNLFVAEFSFVTGDILEFASGGSQTVFASAIAGPGYLACNEFPIIIGDTVSASGIVGQQFVYQIAATNHPGFYNTSALPAGLSLDNSIGLIFGIPTNSGNSSIALSAWNPGGTGFGDLELTVQPAPAGPQIISSTSVTGRTGQPFSFQVLTAGASSAARLSTSPLPPGLTADPIIRSISGTPSSDGNFSITLTITDGPATTSAILQLTFTSDPAVPVITSSDTASLSGGQSFSRTLTADASATFSYIGSDGIKHEGASSAGLPPGLSFDGVNVISGTYTGGNNRDVSHTSDSEKPVTSLHGGSVVYPNTIKIRPPLLESCQLIATNENGTTTAPLNFFQGSPITASQPPDISGIEANRLGGAIVNFTPPTVKDGNGNPLSVTCDPPSGSLFPVGTTTVAATSAPDSSGAYAVVTFNVTIQDTTAPVITGIPVSITVGKQKTAKGQPQGATVNFANQLTATDIADGTFTPSATPASGSFFPLGSTTVSVTATDKHGNSSAPRTFTVNVASKAPKAKAPTVSVSVNPSSINEGQSAIFTISASSTNPSQPLIINYSTTCSATPASQFYTLADSLGTSLGQSGSIAIPSGAASATVRLDAISNNSSDPNETVTMTLGQGSGYKLARVKKNSPNPNQTTVTINNVP